MCWHWPRSSEPVARDQPTWTSWMSMFLLEICFTGIFSVIWIWTSPSVQVWLEGSKYRKVFGILHLHLKASFALIDSIGGLASRPQVGETLHRQRWGTVTIPGHLKVQVAVVYKERIHVKTIIYRFWFILWCCWSHLDTNMTYMHPGKLLCHQFPHLPPPAVGQDS